MAAGESWKRQLQRQRYVWGPNPVFSVQAHIGCRQTAAHALTDVYKLLHKRQGS
jgi:hypothetical protein